MMKASIKITVSPKATKTIVAGTYTDSIKISVAAPPKEGKANAELISYIAKTLGIPKASVTIKKGASSKRKVVEIDGMTTGKATEMLMSQQKRSQK